MTSPVRLAAPLKVYEPSSRDSMLVKANIEECPELNQLKVIFGE